MFRNAANLTVSQPVSTKVLLTSRPLAADFSHTQESPCYLYPTKECTQRFARCGRARCEPADE